MRIATKDFGIFLTILVLLIAAMFMYLSGEEYSIRALNIYSVVFLAIYIAYCLRNSKLSIFSPIMLIVHYMVVESIGIPLSFILTPEYATRRLNRAKMFYGDYLSKYVLLSSIAILVLLLALLVFVKGNRFENINSDQVKSNENVEDSKSSFNYYYQIGLVLLIIFALFSVAGLLTGRIAIFNYSEYKQTGSRLGGYLQRGYWFAAIFVCASGNKKQIAYALPWFLIGSAVLMLAGNRNDVYYPFLVGLGIYQTRFKQLPKALLIGFIGLVFFASPIIILLRNQGTYVRGMFSPIELLGQTMFEFGGQVTAASHMFRWLEEGSGYAYGLTYLLGIIGSIIYPLHLPIQSAIINSPYWIGSRISSIGFAMFAESYYNFGFIGMIISYIVLGKIMSRQIARTSTTIDELVMNGYMNLWLFILIRNAFAFSFTYFMMFLAVYFFEKILRKVATR